MPTTSVITVGDRLAVAQQRAQQTGAGIDRLYLNPVARGVPGIDVHERITAARAKLTLEGASTLTVTIHDPDWLIEASGLLAIGPAGRMHATEVTLDTLAFRLVKASRQNPQDLELTFEDRVVALLRAHTKFKTASRGSVTRARFIEAMVREVTDTAIPFFSPEKGHRQPIQAPDYPVTAPSHGETGFDTGVKLKVKGQTADAQQLREIATAMGVAHQLNAGPRARLALIVAGIGESAFRAVPNAQASGYEGVFQADPKNIPRKDTAEQARSFLRGGKGFQAGGAINLARADPSLSPGQIATRVEASGESGSFYDRYRKEADAIDQAYNAASGSDADSVTYAKAFQFTRGLPSKKETSWEAGTRLAEEVSWRLYAAGGVVAFVSDDFLITTPADLVLEDPLADGLLDRPAYDWDQGKPVGTLELQVIASRWSLIPGRVVALLGDKWGPVKGRWIVLDVDQNLLDPTDCLVTLTKPVPPGLEPAPDLTTGAAAGTVTVAGASAALGWSRDKLGHYKEEFTNNRGAELDRLEGQFDMVGQPWCAMFATTAVAQGAGNQVKTASVADIRAWVAEGSHGYLKGFQRTPRPGDLILNGSKHVALIVKVHAGGIVDTIEGNTSANKVARGSWLASAFDIARPDYRS